MLIFAENLPVIRAGRRPYFLSPEFARFADPDPYEVGQQGERKSPRLWKAIFG
jgi:hypothetical protein